MTPGITWQVWLIVGVLAGSFASSRLSGEARLRWLPDTQWEPRFGARTHLRLAIAFFGAVLVQLGAGIAGGCTSGLAISGGAALAPAAFLFMAGMFAGGIPAAWLWYRGRVGLMLDIIKALALGFLFGWSLQKAGLTHYARIVNVYRFRDMTVMRFMLTALAVGAFGIQAGIDLGLAASAPVPPTSMLANVVGGVVFGVGMATAGYCPGTIVAEAGEGRLDAWVAGLSGLVVGAMVFGLLQPTIMPTLARTGSLGRVTFASLTGASPWLVLLVFGQAVALVLILIARVGREST